MTNPKKILVAYDGSPHSESALAWALYIGDKMSSDISVIKVFEPIVRTYTRGDYNINEEIAAQYAEMEKSDRQMMEDVQAICKDYCSHVHTEIVKGPVVKTLLDYARSGDYDLILVGTKGFGVLNQLLGSVVAKLIKLSEVPVMVVEGLEGEATVKKILVAYDGSRHSKKALDWAFGISRSIGAGVVVVKVFEPMELSMLEGFGSPDIVQKKLAEMADSDKKMMLEVEAVGREQGVEVVTELLDGPTVEAIIDYAQTHGVDMIVAGTKGHGTLEGLLLGSVSQGLVSLFKNPVLVVK